MKIVGRLLILLLAAAVVIGVTYAFSQTAAARSVTGGRGGFEGHGGFGSEFRGAPNQAPVNFGGRGAGQGNFQGGFGGLSLVVVLRNLTLMVGVIVGVQLLRFGWRKVKPADTSA